MLVGRQVDDELMSKKQKMRRREQWMSNHHVVSGPLLRRLRKLQKPSGSDAEGEVSPD